MTELEAAMSYVMLLVGFLLLVAGAELLVRGAARLAARFGVPSLVIGLTIVAFGTSAPELAVSAAAAATGRPDIAVGNVVGSNILNVLLILGVSALIAPLTVARQLVRLDVPAVIAASLGTWALAANGTLDRPEGALLVAALVFYTWYLVRMGRAQPDAPPTGTGSVPLSLLSIAAGLVLLVVGSRQMVEAATAIARSMGVSELVIGLTIVSLGTSLPELATSVVAAVRGERDIAVGNVVGSNLFNLLGVLGISALVAGQGLAVSVPLLRFDFPVMVAAAVACLPIFFTGHRIDRWEGGLFLVYYAAYVSWLGLHASGDTEVRSLVAAAVAFATPLFVLTLLVLAAREMRRPDWIGPDQD